MGIENFNFNPSEEELKATIKEEVINALPDQEKKILTMGESAQESNQSVNRENLLNQLSAQLENFKGQVNWSEFRDALEKSSIPVEEKDAVEKAVSILQSLSKVDDKESLIKRSVRRTIDVATAVNALQKLDSSSENIRLVRDATEKLYDTLGEFADEETKKEAAVITGAIMSEDEFKAAKEKLDRFNVS